MVPLMKTQLEHLVVLSLRGSDKRSFTEEPMMSQHFASPLYLCFENERSMKVQKQNYIGKCDALGGQ